MDIDELKALYAKLLYQDTLDLDDDGARDILQDLIGDEIDRLEKPGECGICGVKVKDLHPYTVGKVHSMICGNCKSIVNMGGLSDE